MNISEIPVDSDALGGLVNIVSGGILQNRFALVAICGDLTRFLWRILGPQVNPGQFDVLISW